MLIWQSGVVVETGHETPNKQLLIIKSSDNTLRNCINYPFLTGYCKVGDEVLYNATAVQLQLGTGGYDFVIANITNPPFMRQQTKEHIIKNRYTPLQFAVQSGEECTSFQNYYEESNGNLEHTSVLIIALHSMLPLLALLLKHAKPTCRIVYVMTDSSALPIWLSDHVLYLKKMNIIDGTITAGQAFGGDIEAINKYSALLLAKQNLAAEYIIIGPGPGSVGTASKWGYSAIEVGELVNAVVALSGIPIVVPRISYSDKRKRHIGLSHHILTALSHVSLASCHLPVPLFKNAEQHDYLVEQIKSSPLEQKHILHWIQPEDPAYIMEKLSHYPLKITSMGRGIDQDTSYFQGVQVAALLASRFA